MVCKVQTRDIPWNCSVSVSTRLSQKLKGITDFCDSCEKHTEREHSTVFQVGPIFRSITKTLWHFKTQSFSTRGQCRINSIDKMPDNMSSQSTQPHTNIWASTGFVHLQSNRQWLVLIANISCIMCYGLICSLCMAALSHTHTHTHRMLTACKTGPTLVFEHLALGLPSEKKVHISYCQLLISLHLRSPFSVLLLSFSCLTSFPSRIILT